MVASKLDYKEDTAGRHASLAGTWPSCASFAGVRRYCRQGDGCWTPNFAPLAARRAQTGLKDSTSVSVLLLAI